MEAVGGGWGGLVEEGAVGRVLKAAHFVAILIINEGDGFIGGSANHFYQFIVLIRKGSEADQNEQLVGFLEDNFPGIMSATVIGVVLSFPLTL